MDALHLQEMGLVDEALIIATDLTDVRVEGFYVEADVFAEMIALGWGEED